MNLIFEQREHGCVLWAGFAIEDIEVADFHRLVVDRHQFFRLSLAALTARSLSTTGTKQLSGSEAD